jgi:hypothetical protein
VVIFPPFEQAPSGVWHESGSIPTPMTWTDSAAIIFLRTSGIRDFAAGAVMADEIRGLLEKTWE